jgi:cytochrome c
MLLKVLAALLLVTFNSVSAQESNLATFTAGAAIFKTCAPCHQVGPNARNGIGPVLNGVVDRPAGQYPEYNYSSANKNSGLVWDEPTLTRYLRAPRDLVPGTKMMFLGLKKDQALADVIAYLKGFTHDGNLANP